MQYCTACQKAIATIVVMDLTEGSVTGSQHVCSACAEQLGVTQPKAPKYTTEVLEDLLGGLTSERPSKPVVEGCPGCGMSIGDFRQKGRVGCPRCYDSFRDELMPLLQRIHESQSHRGRLPSTPVDLPADQEDGNESELTDLRQRLEQAVRNELYEEAASLRDELRSAERRGTNRDEGSEGMGLELQDRDEGEEQ
ncbi:MAG: UvrB/UvrC motif-containing protein [Planctomycetota bacterium]